jgi:hypothetical protein
MSLVAHAAGLAVAGGLLAAAPPAKVTLAAPGHSPKINTHWNYTLSVTRGGKPAAATVTAQIVVFGTRYPVQFGKNTKDIVNWPFKGKFKDYVIWPPSSAVGVPLTFRLTVKTGKTKKVINYTVTPHR